MLHQLLSNSVRAPVIKTINNDAFYLTILYIIGSLLMFNNKLFFIWSSFYITVMFLKTSSFEQTLLYVFFPFSALAVGQLYIVRAIPPEAIQNPYYPEGKQLFFAFSPFYAFLITAVGGVLYQLYKYKLAIKIPSPLLFFLLGALYSFLL